MSISKEARSTLKLLLFEAFSNAVDDIMPEDPEKCYRICRHLDEIAAANGIKTTRSFEVAAHAHMDDA